MGANAQTAVPVFTAGQVLTAAQQNQINTGIPVFATTVTRDAAFGGTGEKTLAEGQFAYIEATNTTQYYDGANWQAVGASGLTFITGATFTTATSVSLPNSTFTSTYTNYKIVYNMTALTSDADLTLRLRAAGTDSSGASYFWSYRGLDVNNNASDAAGNNATSFGAAELDSAFPFYTFNVDLFNPEIAQYTNMLGSIVFVAKAGATTTRNGGGINTAATSFDSVTLISSVASSMTGNYKVYGYSNSQVNYG